MWWKLVILTLLTVVLIVSVIPIRTHAVKYDAYSEPPPQTWSFSALLQSMYVTPSTLALIVGILIVAAGVAFWIIRAAK
jgi:hypothetical protein